MKGRVVFMKKISSILLTLCMLVVCVVSAMPVSAAYGQNGNNEIADAVTYQCITEKITAYAAEQGIDLSGGTLSYAYLPVDPLKNAERGTFLDGKYVTFQMEDAGYASGYFTCSAGEEQDCTYTPLHSSLFLDAMYNERWYTLYSAKSCLIEGKSYDLVMELEGKVYDLRDDTVISEQELSNLRVESLLTGDVNLDGGIDITDVVLLNQFASGSVELTAVQQKNADCNGDGNADQTDAVVLLQFLLRIVDTLPATAA